MIKEYFATWWTIIVRPIYFYTKLKEEDWKGSALTFLLITAWLLALAATLDIFIIQYIPLGSTLVGGVPQAKFIIILPVLLTLAFAFFVITILIVGGLFSGLFLAMLWLVAWLLNYVCVYLGGRGNLNRLIQSSLYSGAVLLAFGLVFLLTILTKYAGLDFVLFRVGYNFIYFLMLLYLYGLWAVACRKHYALTKGKAFLAALAPVIALLIFGILFDKIVLVKLRSWIT